MSSKDKSVVFCLAGTVSGVGTRVSVPANGLQIGRDKSCGLRLDDLEVSRLHCRVYVEDGQLKVADESHNGTFVNGVRIEGSAKLNAGDQLKVGAQSFAVELVSSKSRFSISWVSGGKSSESEVPADGLELGRSRECGLVVDDAQASRRHCTIRIVGEELKLEDHSSNGTYVNGRRIHGTVVLGGGDVLRIGVHEFAVQDRGHTHAAGRSSPAGVLKPGDMVDRYRVKSLIGAGGMGMVYEVEHIGLDVPRALKALSLPVDDNYQAFRKKFLDEGKILARLKHDNITQVYDASYDEKTNTLFFVMDLVLYEDGKPCTLADVSAEDYDEFTVTEWFQALASALDYVHRQGIVHSDIKLENVLLSADQKLKLADFGVAHLLTVGKDDAVAYTPHYVAPEILRGRMPSAASDTYSLGVLLVRLLTGLWYDENPSALERISRRCKLNWRPVLAQMLCSDPQKRVTSLVKLSRELRNGTKVSMRRRLIVESRRRRQQKIRFRRVPRGDIGRLGSIKYSQTTLVERILRGALIAVGAVVSLTVAVVMVKMYRDWTDNAARSQEQLNCSRKDSQKAIDRLLVEIQSKIPSLREKFRKQLLEKQYVTELMMANVTSATDQVMSECRNEVLLKYCSVLDNIDRSRHVLDGVEEKVGEVRRQISQCQDTNSVAEILQKITEECARRRNAIDRFVSDDVAYGEYVRARQRLHGELSRRESCAGCRRLAVACVTNALSSCVEVGAAAEMREAKQKLEAGDEAILSCGDYGEAEKLYSEVLESVSGGVGRLKREKEEREKIRMKFAECDARVREALQEIAQERKVVASQVERMINDACGSFDDAFNAGDCACKRNADLVDKCRLSLRLRKRYLEYLKKRVGASRQFEIVEDGIMVIDGNVSACCEWRVILGEDGVSRAQVVADRRRKILKQCQVADGDNANAELLLGRWLVMKDLAPHRNNDAMSNRVAKAVLQLGGAALEIGAKERLPGIAVHRDVESVAGNALGVDDFPDAAPIPKADLSCERVVFFCPRDGLNFEAIGRDGLGFKRCELLSDGGVTFYPCSDSRLRKIENRVFPSVLNGITSTGQWRDANLTIEIGRCFQVHNDSSGDCLYCLHATFADGFEKGAQLLFVRCKMY